MFNSYVKLPEGNSVHIATFGTKKTKVTTTGDQLGPKSVVQIFGPDPHGFRITPLGNLWEPEINIIDFGEAFRIRFARAQAIEGFVHEANGHLKCDTTCFHDMKSDFQEVYQCAK